MGLDVDFQEHLKKNKLYCTQFQQPLNEQEFPIEPIEQPNTFQLTNIFNQIQRTLGDLNRAGTIIINFGDNRLLIIGFRQEPRLNTQQLVNQNNERGIIRAQRQQQPNRIYNDIQRDLQIPFSSRYQEQSQIAIDLDRTQSSTDTQNRNNLNLSVQNQQQEHQIEQVTNRMQNQAQFVINQIQQNQQQQNQQQQNQHNFQKHSYPLQKEPKLNQNQIQHNGVQGLNSINILMEDMNRMDQSENQIKYTKRNEGRLHTKFNYGQNQVENNNKQEKSNNKSQSFVGSCWQSIKRKFKSFFRSD